MSVFPISEKKIPLEVSKVFVRELPNFKNKDVYLNIIEPITFRAVADKFRSSDYLLHHVSGDRGFAIYIADDEDDNLYIYGLLGGFYMCKFKSNQDFICEIEFSEEHIVFVDCLWGDKSLEVFIPKRYRAVKDIVSVSNAFGVTISAVSHYAVRRGIDLFKQNMLGFVLIPKKHSFSGDVPIIRWTDPERQEFFLTIDDWVKFSVHLEHINDPLISFSDDVPHTESCSTIRDIRKMKLSYRTYFYRMFDKNDELVYIKMRHYCIPSRAWGTMCFRLDNEDISTFRKICFPITDKCHSAGFIMKWLKYRRPLKFIQLYFDFG